MGGEPTMGQSGSCPFSTQRAQAREEVLPPWWPQTRWSSPCVLGSLSGLQGTAKHWVEETRPLGTEHQAVGSKAFSLSFELGRDQPACLRSVLRAPETLALPDQATLDKSSHSSDFSSVAWLKKQGHLRTH